MQHQQCGAAVSPNGRRRDIYVDRVGEHGRTAGPATAARAGEAGPPAELAGGAVERVDIMARSHGSARGQFARRGQTSRGGLGLAARGDPTPPRGAAATACTCSGPSGRRRELAGPLVDVHPPAVPDPRERRSLDPFPWRRSDVCLRPTQADQETLVSVLGEHGLRAATLRGQTRAAVTLEGFYHGMPQYPRFSEPGGTNRIGSCQGGTEEAYPVRGVICGGPGPVTMTSLRRRPASVKDSEFDCMAPGRAAASARAR